MDVVLLLFLAVGLLIVLNHVVRRAVSEDRKALNVRRKARAQIEEEVAQFREELEDLG